LIMAFPPVNRPWRSLALAHLSAGVSAGHAPNAFLVSSIEVHVLKTGCRWCYCRPNMVLRPRFIIALCVGPNAGFGRTCSGTLPGADDPQTHR